MINTINIACNIKHDLNPFSIEKSDNHQKPSLLERIGGIAVFLFSIPLTLGLGTAFLLYTAHRKVVYLNNSNPEYSSKTQGQTSHKINKLRNSRTAFKGIHGKSAVVSSEDSAESGPSDTYGNPVFSGENPLAETVDEVVEIKYSVTEFKQLLLEGHDFSGKIKVEGDLYLSDCTSLTSLPKGLEVRGDLYLSDCTSLTSLPEGLKVEGDLKLSGCTSLTSLPEGFEVGGDLDFTGCTSLTSLPKGLKVGGDFNLSICRSLTSLPKGLKVGGDFNLSICRSLTSLPEGFEVGGDLNLSHCTSLTSLPKGLEVRGCLNLFHCTSLTSLPKGLKVGGDLDFTGCTRLTSLPEGLEVRGYLNLSHCRSLTSLSADLKVGGDLDLFHCRGLTSLPEGFEVGGDLDFTGCTRLTSLPNSITQLGVLSDGEMRVINLTGTGLSETIIQDLQQSEHPGIQFHFSQAAQQPSSTFESLNQGLQYWAELAGREQAPDVVIGEYTQEVVTFLSRLTTTQEYKNLQTRKFLAQRIMDVFDLMGKDDKIKENAVNLIYEGLTSCDDRIISALNEIELMTEVYQIETGDHDEEDLKTLGKCFLLLEMVNKKAAEHIETLSFVDEIEVYLAFQIGLADRFKLPIKTRNMIFRNCADVTDQKIKEYGDTIEQECTEEKLNTFLESWSPWVKLLKSKVKVPSYDKLPADGNNYEKKDLVCAIFKDEPESPVSYEGTIYGYDAFVQQYKANGTNPMKPSEEIDLKLLKRVEAPQENSN